MTDEVPQAPASIPKYIRDGLEKQDEQTLRDIAEYAGALAEFRQAETTEEEAAEDTVEETDAVSDEELDRRDAPARATRVTKEINENRYYYWQWREGEKIKSEYIGPVKDSENG